MTLHLTKNQLLWTAFAWEGLFLALSATQSNPLQLLTIFGTLTLLILPGFLTCMALRLHVEHGWAYIGVVLGFSILELMLVGLIGNTFLPLWGIAAPLGRRALMGEFASLISILIGIGWARGDTLVVSLRSFGIFESTRDAVYALTPALFIVMSVVGAVQLNNGGTNTATLFMLICMAIFSALLVQQSKTLGAAVLPTALFCMALSLLLMTSLRGWYITGHDIQREYGVFQLAKAHGIWNIAQYRDAYNACMSITILPVMLSNFLTIPDPYIFKVVFQVIFAVVPAMLYLLFRRYVSAAYAFLSVLFFISFPTFFGDMPFLNRQEIAFLFFALMLYVLFDRHAYVRKSQVLFVVFGIGMVLSHYTTTYIVVALLLFLAVVRPAVHFLGRFFAPHTVFKHSAIMGLRDMPRPKAFIALWMVAALTLASFFWSSIITQTASESLVRVLVETVAVIRNNVAEDSHSNDVNYSLFAPQQVVSAAVFAGYQQHVVADTRAANPTAYFSTQSYQRYPALLDSGDTMPLTVLGRSVQSVGINVNALHTFVRQNSAKLLQVLIMIGLVAAVFTGAYVEYLIDTEFVLLAVASLLFIAAQVVLPVLSVEYGVLRAFQQSLFFLSLFIVGGCVTLLYKLSPRTKLFITTLLALCLLLSSTGVFTQLLGGYGAQLHLNNAGAYYDEYYLHTSEVRGIEWLKARDVNPESIQTSTLLSSAFGLDSGASSDIFPGLVRKDSYVLLGYATATKHEASVVYQGTELTYHYPVEFLDDNKALIYTNGEVTIYR